MQTYSFSKGLGKGITYVLVGVASLLVVTGVSDLTITDLFTTYVQPFVGTLSVGAILTIVINWLKVRSK